MKLEKSALKEKISNVNNMVRKIDYKMYLMYTAVIGAIISLQCKQVCATNLFDKGKDLTQNIYNQLTSFSLYLAVVCAVGGLIGYMMSGNPNKAEKRKDYVIKVIVCYFIILVIGYLFAYVKELANGAPDPFTM